ncbi:MAG TPA: type II secretion system protein [bacterium]|nr:type II secretion system protein [bacterium]
MKKGFTLIELLVVIAIIAMLSTLSVVALNSARAKSRDARRASDIKQIRTALEMYQDKNNEMYPPTPSATNTLGTSDTNCLNDTGFVAIANCTGTVYMQNIPSDPQSPSGKAYVYTRGSGEKSTYTLSYTLEGTGKATATEASMN